MKKTIIGIQGGAGSYHEMVTRQYFGENSTISYQKTFQDVFNALQSDAVSHGVIAIANNRYGFIPESFSLLMDRHTEITITGETYLPVQHQLLAAKGAVLEDITEIYSQAPAIGQCGQFLKNNLPAAALIEEEDTALSAKLVSENNKSHQAAIASRGAAQLYNLEIIAQNIQDDKNNITRFYIIQKSSTPAAQTSNKTTALLKTAQTPGALVDALLPFKKQGINISTLHSAFLPNTDFDMQFLIEFDSGLHDPNTEVVMQQLYSHGALLIPLGTYTANTPS